MIIKKGNNFYAEGTAAQSCVLYKKGMVKNLQKANKDGKELITAIYTSGDFFGYLYVLEDITYRENAEALEDCELMLIPRQDFISLIAADAQVAKQFIKLITHNVLDKEESLLNLAYNSLRRKVAYQLVQVYEKIQAGKRQQYYSYFTRKFGACCRHCHRIAYKNAFRFFKKPKKLIDLKGGDIIILNEEKLRNLPY